MKQKILNLSMLLLCMIVGLGSAWGENYEIVFKTSNADGSSSIAANANLDNVISSGKQYISGFTSNCNKAYYASKEGVKLGSSSAAGTLEFNIAEAYKNNIKSITIYSSKYGSDSGNLKLTDNYGELKNNITPGNSYTYTYSNAKTVSTIKIETTSKRAYISKIVLSTESSNILNDATWSVDPTSLTVEVGNTTTATITTNYDGKLSVVSSSENVAKASIVNNEITIEGVSEGSTSLTVSGSATSTFKAINKNIEVTVRAKSNGNEESTHDDLVITYNFNNINDYPEDFPKSKQSDASTRLVSATISGNPIVIKSTESYYSINYTTTKCALFFGKSTTDFSTTSYLGFPAKTGYKLTKVVATDQDGCAGGVSINIYDVNGTAISNACKTINGGKTIHEFKLSNTEENTEYRLASLDKGKNCQFDNIVLYYEKVSADTPVDPTPNNSVTFKATNDGTNYWATFSSTDNIVLPNEVVLDENEGDYAELTVYKVYAVGDMFEIKELTEDNKFDDGWYLPADYGYLLKSESTTTCQHSYTYTVRNDGTFGGIPTENLEDNMLYPSSYPMSSVEGDNYFYKLSTYNGEHVGFYWGAEDGGEFTMKNANGAYLAVPKSAGVKSLSLESLTTAIKAVENKINLNAPIYNLAGQRVNASAKGILIQNGKKFFNK